MGSLVVGLVGLVGLVGPTAQKRGGGKNTALEIVRGIRTVHTPALLLLILKYSYTAA